MTTLDKKASLQEREYGAVVIGGSAGSTVIFPEILGSLPGDFPLPVLLVQHLHETDDGYFAAHLERGCRLSVMVPCDKQPIERGYVYVAPANYHMLVERNRTVALSVDPKVNWSRPSIDVLFESAAHACRTLLIAVLLSGASTDGARGMRFVQEYGGVTIAQSPETAEFPLMPQAAINATHPTYVVPPQEIARLILNLCANPFIRRPSDGSQTEDFDRR